MIDTVGKAETVNVLLRQWYLEGRKLPDYSEMQGHSYLAKLLDVEYFPMNRLESQELYFRKFEAQAPGLYDRLLGPHGWTFMRMMIVQMQEREANDKAKEGIETT